MFFGKLTVEQVLKSFSGRNNSLKPPVFGFSNSFLYGLEESRELSCLDYLGFDYLGWLFGLIGIQKRKKKKYLPTIFFCS